MNKGDGMCDLIISLQDSSGTTIGTCGQQHRKPYERTSGSGRGP